MTVHRPDPETDPFRPPAIPTEVFCLHCQQEYESYLIEWREETVEGKRTGFWCCPTRGCDGKGFGFDIFPVDPEYRDENGEPMGLFDDDEDADDDDAFDADDDAFDAAWDEPIDADALLDDNPPPDRAPPRHDPPPINLDEPRHRRHDDDDIPW